MARVSVTLDIFMGAIKAPKKTSPLVERDGCYGLTSPPTGTPKTSRPPFRRAGNDPHHHLEVT